MVMGRLQHLTTGSMPLTTMGARKMVPSSIERMVPLGLFHIWCRWYSSTRWALGVMVAHLTATPRRLVASAESMVTWSPVSSRCLRPRS